MSFTLPPHISQTIAGRLQHSWELLRHAAPLAALPKIQQQLQPWQWLLLACRLAVCAASVMTLAVWSALRTVCSAARDAFQQSLFEVFKRDGGFNLLQREQDEKKAAFHVVKATACFEA
jgi:hypothetical protein